MLGSLPFPYTATVRTKAGDALGTISMAWWPAERRVTRTGSQATHTGEAPLGSWDLLDPVAHPNGRLVVAGGPTFVILSAERQEFLPHVTLTLRDVQNQA